MAGENTGDQGQQTGQQDSGTTPPTGTGTPPAGTTTGAERSFTQADLDRIVAERVSRERGKYQDYDDLKSKAARLEELEAANASDMEKAAKAARTEGEKAAAEKYQGIIREATVAAAAVGMKFRDGEDAVAQLAQRGTLSAIRVNDDGSVDKGSVERELKALAEAKPYLLVQETTPPPASPAQAGIGAGSNTDTKKADVAPGLPRMRAAFGASGK